MSICFYGRWYQLCSCCAERTRDDDEDDLPPGEMRPDAIFSRKEFFLTHSEESILDQSLPVFLVGYHYARRNFAVLIQID